MHFTIQVTQRLKKLVRSLHQKQYRDQNQLFIAEGEKICSELRNSEYVTELLVVKDSPSSDVIEIAEYYSDKGVPVYTAPKHQFDQMTDAKTPQGILAVVNEKKFEPMNDKNFIALDGVSDPGNIGTIVRNADWYGFEQVFLGRDCADPYNPKAVRASMGSIFRIKTIYEPNLHELLFEEFKGHKLIGAALDTKKVLTDIKPKGKFGLIFGNESQGISEEVRSKLNDEYKIMGYGKAESLNVAVSVGISLNHFVHYNS